MDVEKPKKILTVEKVTQKVTLFKEKYKAFAEHVRFQDHELFGPIAKFFETFIPYIKFVEKLPNSQDVLQEIKTIVKSRVDFSKEITPQLEEQMKKLRKILNVLKKVKKQSIIDSPDEKIARLAASTAKLLHDHRDAYLGEWSRSSDVTPRKYDRLTKLIEDFEARLYMETESVSKNPIDLNLIATELQALAKIIRKNQELNFSKTNKKFYGLFENAAFVE